MNQLLNAVLNNLRTKNEVMPSEDAVDLVIHGYYKDGYHKQAQSSGRNNPIYKDLITKDFDVTPIARGAAKDIEITSVAGAHATITAERR